MKKEQDWGKRIMNFILESLNLCFCDTSCVNDKNYLKVEVWSLDGTGSGGLAVYQ